MTPCPVDFSVRSVQIPNRSTATDVTVEDIMALEKTDRLFNIVGVITMGDNPLETRWLRDGTNALIKTDAVIEDSTGCIPLEVMGIDVQASDERPVSKANQGVVIQTLPNRS